MIPIDQNFSEGLKPCLTTTAFLCNIDVVSWNANHTLWGDPFKCLARNSWQVWPKETNDASTGSVPSQKTRDNPFLAFWQSRIIMWVPQNPWNQSRESRMLQYCLLEENCHSSLKHMYQFSGSLTPQNDKCTLDQPWLAGKSSLRMFFFIFNGRGILQVLITRGYGLSHGLSNGLSLIPRSCVQIPSWSWKPWSVAWSSLHFSRMRSKGSRFTLGVWGLRVCSLDVAFVVATVRNRPRDPHMAVPMVSSAEVVVFVGFKHLVASFRVAGVALRDIQTCFVTCRESFRVAGAILLRRFPKMRCSFRGRRSTLDVSIVILRGRRSTLDVSCCVFFANRIGRAASNGDKVQIPWQAWHFVRCDENWRKPRTKHRFWGSTI